jgi:hypothetical protein
MSPNPGAQTKHPPGIGDHGGWVNGVFYKLFFYRDGNGAERGPIDQGLLEALRLSGYIDKNTLIREKNSSVWKRLDGKPAKPSELSTKTTAPSISRSYGSVENQGDKSTNELETFLKVVGGIAALIILLLIIASASSNNSSTTSSSTRTTASSYTPVTTSTPYPTPESVPLPTATPVVLPSRSMSQSTSLAGLVYTPTPNPTPSYSSGNYSQNDGATYRVSHYTSQSHNFSARKSLLDSQQRQLAGEKSQLQALGSEIDMKRIYLNTKSQSDVDEFNAKVDAYNNQKQQLQIKLDAFNREVDQYNSELEQVGRRQ